MREPWQVKLKRAKQHLTQLDRERRAYERRHPYEVLGRFKRQENKRVWLGCLHVTEQPDGDRLAVLAGDAVHNMRSALDHMMIALGKPSDTSFPILTEDLSLDQRVYPCTRPCCDPRARWRHTIDGVPKAAITIIESAQPYHNGPDAKINALALLSCFDNADKHRKLLRPKVGFGNVKFEVRARGQIMPWVNDPTRFYKDGADIAGFEDRFDPPLTETEVDVQGSATLEISLSAGEPVGYVGLWTFRQTYDYILDLVTDLEPFVGSKD